MTTKTKRWLALGIALGLVLACLALLANARWKLASYRAQLCAQGAKLTVEELVPPSVPEEQNAGPQLEVLVAQLRDGLSTFANFTVADTMRLVAPGRARISWRQPQMPAGLYGTNVAWEAVATVHQTNQALLHRVRALLERPRLDLRLNYQGGFNGLSPQLTTQATVYRAVARWLARSASLTLHEGNLNAATADLHALLQLARLQAEEPLILCQLLQQATVSMALNATWEALQAPTWSDDQMALLQRDWQALEFIRPLERSLEMERAIVLGSFPRLRRSGAELGQLMWEGGILPNPSPPAPAPSPPATPPSRGWFRTAADWIHESVVSTARGGMTIVWQWYWSYPDELNYLKFMRAALAGVERVPAGMPYKAASDQLLAEFRRQGFGEENIDRRLVVSCVNRYEVNKLLARTARTEALRQLALAAIALERYRHVHGKLAPTLEALVPEFLSKKPIDSLDGQPLRYQPHADGTFLLYSVGEDGRDDGGDPRPALSGSASLNWLQGRDWVWPEVASPQEVDAFAAKNKFRRR